MRKTKPEMWTKENGQRFVLVPLSEFQRLQELAEDAGLSRIMKESKQRQTGKPTISLSKMKRELGISSRRKVTAG
ncbi:MAG TPA: hypothetical protein VGG19_06890 [Tepidisphaeraceae bacterium]|jgi:hypothetical protein